MTQNKTDNAGFAPAQKPLAASGDDERHVRLAEAASALRRFDAIGAATMLRLFTPARGDADYWRLLIEATFQAAKYDRLRQAVAGLGETGSIDAEAAAKLVYASLDSRDFETAATQFSAIKGSLDGSPFQFAITARLDAARQDYDQSQKNLRKAILLNPAFSLGYNDLCQLIAARNSALEAWRFCRFSLVSAPHRQAPVGVLKKIALSGELGPETLKFMRGFAVSCEAIPDAQFSAATFFQHHKLLNDAEAALWRCCELRPDWAEAHFMRGTVVSSMVRAGSSGADAFRAASDLKPDWAEAHFRYGLALVSQSVIDQPRGEQAISSLRRALALDRRQQQWRIVIARVLLRLRHLDEAAEEFRRLLVLFPSVAQYYREFSAMSGDLDGAQGARVQAWSHVLTGAETPAGQASGQPQATRAASPVEQFYAGEMRDDQAIRFQIASMPKTGSTYLRECLACLPGFANLSVTEEAMSLLRLLQNRRANIVSKVHTPLEQPIQQVIENGGFYTIVLTRNMFDIVMSIRDHLRREGYGPWQMVQFDPAMAEWPEEKFLAFVVDMVMPWYINCFVSWYNWKNDRKILVTYEEVIADTENVVGRIVALTGVALNADQIRNAISEATSVRYTRKNKGVAGRGQGLSDSLKARIRSYTEAYPDIDFSPMGL